MKTYCYTEEELKLKRDKERVEARCCFVWFCKNLTGLSNKRTGALIGRAESTITHHHGKIKGMVRKDREQITVALWDVFTNLKQLHNERV